MTERERTMNTIRVGNKTFKELLERAVKRTVEEVMGKVRRLIDETYIPKIIEKVNAHDKILRGNGQEGLVAKVAIMEARSKRVDEHIDNFEEFVTNAKVDQQKVMDTLKEILATQRENKTDLNKRMDASDAAIEKRLKPLEGVIRPYLKHVTIVGTILFLIGAIISGIVFNFSSIMEFLKWIISSHKTP